MYRLLLLLECVYSRCGRMNRGNRRGAAEAGDARWMREAVEAAREAARRGEVPVGAVVVDGGEVVLAVAGNRTRTDCDPTAHAEVVALREAARRAGNYRLTGATVYSTIEPCAMCAGALVQARVARLVYGARDERAGAVESVFRVCDSGSLNTDGIGGGLSRRECGRSCKSFPRPTHQANDEWSDE